MLLSLTVYGTIVLLIRADVGGGIGLYGFCIVVVYACPFDSYDESHKVCSPGAMLPEKTVWQDDSEN